MLFNSAEFFLFFPVVVFLYFLLPFKSRVWFLLGASYFFYASWKIEYLGLILFSTLIDYYVGLQIGDSKEKSKKKRWLYLSIFANLSILFVFKYYNFFIENATELLGFLGLNYVAPIANLLLPIGISFYTFQSMSYSIDVYNGKIEPEKNFGVFALYVSFFPQLVAGPIERANRLLPQLKKNYNFEYERVVSGLKQMLWGFFKKLVIADNLASIVDLIYSSPGDYGGLLLLFGTYCFAFQIYCDFSGYSDIAIGAARVLGINLMENFNLPYLSKSIPEFWKRWHISLSEWFRDYVYIPLGGNRVSSSLLIFNIMAVFTISGLWHGANWTFIIWGGLHGLFYLAFRKYKKHIEKLPIFLTTFLTFQIVAFCWIFFRANSLADAFFIIESIALSPFNYTGLENVIKIGNLGHLIIKITLLLTFLFLNPLMEKIIKGKRKVSNNQGHLIFGTILTGIFLFGYFGEVTFIYFQF